MRHYRFPIALLQPLLLALVMAGCSDSPSLPMLAGDATVLAFGDSLTHGTGTTRDKAYPARLEALIGRRVINAGVPGETTGEGRQRLPGTLDQYRPDLVLLCLGGNDFLRKRDPAATRADLAAMLDTLRKRDIPVLLIAVPELTLLGGDHALYAELADQYQVPLLTGELNRILRDAELKSDRVHANAAGYAELAEAVAARLREAGALP
ncbi:MAG: arylesterase [Salinisphaeraceae bacterium]